MARKRTPNVLGDLMGEERQQTSKASKQQDSKPASRQDAKAARRQASKPVSQRLSSDAKTKVTVYLSGETAYDLDAAKVELRRILEPANLKDVTKSSIVEVAVVLALQDLESRGEQSAIVAELRAACEEAPEGA